MPVHVATSRRLRLVESRPQCLAQVKQLRRKLSDCRQSYPFRQTSEKKKTGNRKGLPKMIDYTVLALKAFSKIASDQRLGLCRHLLQILAVH